MHAGKRSAYIQVYDGHNKYHVVWSVHECTNLEALRSKEYVRTTVVLVSAEAKYGQVNNIKAWYKLRLMIF